MSTLNPDFSMANRFINLLTGSEVDPVTFQFFSDKDKRNRSLAIHRTMKRPLTYDYHRKKQDAGCGVYVMVNRGDGKGRAKKNVVEILALFIDLDGAPWEPAAKMLKPHIIVESSPGRYHLYWLVSDCDLEQFKPIQQALAAKFGGDKACCDLPRVLRVPGFLHLKGKPFLTCLIEANDFPRYTTKQVIDGLGLELNDQATATQPPRTQQAAIGAPVSKAYEYVDKSGEVHDLTTWAARNPLFDLVGNFNKQYVRGEIKDGKQHVICPFEHAHTSPDIDLSTFVVNACPPQYPAFDIHCMHSHCAGRDRLDFLAVMFDKGMLSPDILQTPVLQMRRPSKIYFPVNEISTALEWKTLNANEYRVALHLMALAWAMDGSLPDDDWLLARGLGMPETDWRSYRDTLIKTSWLIVQDGRLTNSIVMREFLNAQKALMDAIETRS